MTNMLHHISFAVSDITRSSLFYDACLEALGYKRVYSSDHFIGYGVEEGKDKFAIVNKSKKILLPETGLHIAFSAPNRDSIDQFFSLAIENGGKDNGAPGLRDHYGKNYYAAFVIDPDGYHIEAVFNQPI